MRVGRYKKTWTQIVLARSPPSPPSFIVTAVLTSSALDNTPATMLALKTALFAVLAGSAASCTLATPLSPRANANASDATPNINSTAMGPPMMQPGLLPYGAANLSSSENATAGPYGLDNAQCTNMTLQIAANAENIRFEGVDQEYSNQSYITGTALRFANFQMPYLAEHENGTLVNDKSYSIHATYCEPKKGKRNDSALIAAVHGVGFSSSYWDFSYSPEYSLVKQAASHGYSIFTYDRLGTGASEAPPNGFDEPQAATEVSLLTAILTKLRDGTLIKGKKFPKIVGVGHSYGSIQVQAVTHYAPALLDGAVLTGYSNSSASIAQFVLGANFRPAAEVFPGRMGNKPRVWLATGSDAADMTLFFWPPNFAPGAFHVARGSADAVTLGSLVSMAAVAGPAPNFTGPVYVLSGERDLPFCGNDCTTGGKLEGVKALYPMAKNFSTTIVPETGHGLVPHYTGPQSQRDTLQFIMDNGL